MTTSILAQAILVDSSAAFALEHGGDQYHEAATEFFESAVGVVWVSLNITAHETYTRARYALGFEKALKLYDFLTGDLFLSMAFTAGDESVARDHLVRFRERRLSFHDALAAAAMKRVGIYRVFSFDNHFYCFGFEVLPGPTR